MRMQTARRFLPIACALALGCSPTDRGTGAHASGATGASGVGGVAASGGASGASGASGAGGSTDLDPPSMIDTDTPTAGTAGTSSTAGTSGTSGTADAGTAIDTEHDGGIISMGILVSFPEWTLPDYILCLCKDDTTLEQCLDLPSDSGLDMDAACMPLCASHGGISATGAELASRFCDRPTLDGPDQLSCHCSDGHEESLCADLACFSDDQRMNLCTPFCAEHGGTTRTDCLDFAYDVCIPPGTTLVTCGCLNGEVVRHCTSNDCTQGVFTGEDCRASCADKGGGDFTGCVPDEPTCM